MQKVFDIDTGAIMGTFPRNMDPETALCLAVLKSKRLGKRRLKHSETYRIETHKYGLSLCGLWIKQKK